MKFLLDMNGVAAVNLRLVKKFAIKKIYSEGWDETKFFRVIAELSYEDDEIILKEFKTDDADKNFEMAKKYLAELVTSLNGGNLQ